MTEKSEVKGKRQISEKKELEAERRRMEGGRETKKKVREAGRM